MEKSKSVEIPKYSFNRSADLSSEEKARVFEYLDNLTIDKGGQLLDISPERKAEIEELLNNQILWAEEYLGLRVKQSLPHEKKIRFYSLEEFEKIFPESRGRARMEIGSKDIFCKEVEGEEQFTLAALNHELVHALASHAIFIERIPKNNDEYGIKLEEFRTGYNNPRTGAFKYLNEIATEMINIEMLDFLRKKGGRDHLSGTTVAYHAGVILFDMIIDQAAAKLDISNRDLKKNFYTGYFLGDISKLKFIDDVFGKGALKSMAELTKTDYDREAYQKLCHIFNINFNTFKDKGGRYWRGKEIEVLGGIKLQTDEFLKDIKNEF
jgi:hypothetical protein